MEKKQLRKIMKEKRKTLLAQDCNLFSKQIEKRLYALMEFQKAKMIYTYVSYQQEAETKNIIENCFKWKKRVAVPKVLEKQIEFFEISSFSDLEAGYQKILEPKTKIPLQASCALILVPGLAFDLEYNRLGYGGGFYDKYLKEHRTDFFQIIGLAYDFQIVEKLEIQIYDEKVDKIITPSRII